MSLPVMASLEEQDEFIHAPMTAFVTKVFLKEIGATFRKGDPLFLIEAMKMECLIRAPEDGVVGALLISENEMVQANQSMLECAKRPQTAQTSLSILLEGPSFDEAPVDLSHSQEAPLHPLTQPFLEDSAPAIYVKKNEAEKTPITSPADLPAVQMDQALLGRDDHMLEAVAHVHDPHDPSGGTGGEGPLQEIPLTPHLPLQIGEVPLEILVKEEGIPVFSPFSLKEKTPILQQEGRSPVLISSSDVPQEGLREIPPLRQEQAVLKEPVHYGILQKEAPLLAVVEPEAQSPVLLPPLQEKVPLIPMRRAKMSPVVTRSPRIVLPCHVFPPVLSQELVQNVLSPLQQSEILEHTPPGLLLRQEPFSLEGARGELLQEEKALLSSVKDFFMGELSVLKSPDSFKGRAGIEPNGILTQERAVTDIVAFDPLKISAIEELGWRQAERKAVSHVESLETGGVAISPSLFLNTTSQGHMTLKGDIPAFGSAKSLHQAPFLQNKGADFVKVSQSGWPFSDQEVTQMKNILSLSWQSLHEWGTTPLGLFCLVLAALLAMLPSPIGVDWRLVARSLKFSFALIKVPSSAVSLRTVTVFVKVKTP